MKKYKQRKDGRYATNVWDGTYQNGRKHYICIMASSARELEEKVRQTKNLRDDGSLVVSSEVTLFDYSVRWLQLNKSVMEKATQALYEHIIYKRLDALGSVAISSLTHSAIQGRINELSSLPRTCQIFVTTLKQVIRSAERDKLLPRGSLNDLTGDLAVPRYKPKERRVLTPYEIEAIKNADFTDRERAYIYIIYTCGLRREEALALSRFDVNLEDCTLSVNKAIGFYKNNPYLKDTKSSNGVRVVPLPPYVVEFLRGYILSLETAELFPRAPGVSGYFTDSIYKRFWKKIKAKMEAAYLAEHPASFVDWQKVGIRSLTAHIFRHNYCTKLCYVSVKTGDISTKKIAELLGDSEAMVLRVYSHVIEENEKPAAAVSSAFAL